MSTRTMLRCAVAFLAALFLSASAHALIFRAYLASDGNDAHPCTLTQPCRLLPAALAATASGGEIWMLDSANYNTATVTIDKSVSILAVPGAVGSVVATGGPALTITTLGTVALRNLVIVPLPGSGATHGVSMVGAAASLTIENSLIANLPGEGVRVEFAGTVKITDTIIRNNGGYAVWLQGDVRGSISRTQMLGNGFGGVRVYGTAAVTTAASITDSIISGGIDGVYVHTIIAGADARAFVARSTIVGTNYALQSLTPGSVGSTLITVSYGVITNNGFGWFITGPNSVIKSLGNNDFADNTSNTGSLTSTPLQ